MVLLRSIYSVLMRTPPELLADVIVVDDASTKQHRKLGVGPRPTFSGVVLDIIISGCISFFLYPLV